jgi:hypothetical protein
VRLCNTLYPHARDTPLQIAASGNLLGVASFFTQTQGVAVAIAIFLAWERSRTNKSWRALVGYRLLLFCGFGVVRAILSVRFTSPVGIEQL